jgi:hypothetical protein
VLHRRQSSASLIWPAYFVGVSANTHPHLHERAFLINVVVVAVVVAVTAVPL